MIRLRVLSTLAVMGAMLAVPGIQVVGPLPADIQTIAIFAAGQLTHAPQPQQASKLLAFLASAAIAPLLLRSGLQPA